MKRLISTLTLVLSAALTLAGCGGDDSSTGGTNSASSSSSSSSSSDFNDADVTFAQSMIPHHQQAVQMAQMARANGSSPGVKRLAEKVEAAQGPEIDTMKGWLEDWGKKVPSTSMSGMDHGSGSMGSDDMPGMMSDADMTMLDGKTGAGFDRMFLTMMIEHHTGAIQMARTEQSGGKNADAVALANQIQADQTAELTRMRRLLTS
jgi:uncharacterized protein (DUF305 family)